jgi:hypothetical protein
MRKLMDLTDLMKNLRKCQGMQNLIYLTGTMLPAK